MRIKAQLRSGAVHFLVMFIVTNPETEIALEVNIAAEILVTVMEPQGAFPHDDNEGYG